MELSMTPTLEPKALLVSGMSRSGTTLLAAMLDAHSSIAMGYELLPGKLPPLSEFAELLERAWVDGKQSPRRAGNLLKEWGHPQAGVFSKRASRTLVDPPELAQIVRNLVDHGQIYCETLEQRFVIATHIAKHKATNQGASWYGFKSPPIDLELAQQFSQETRTILIHRDPRDVWVSHLDAGFSASLKEVIKSWKAHAKQGVTSGAIQSVIRYEDLVSTPEAVLAPICERLGLHFEETMINFEGSKASIFREGLHHVNSPKLKAGLNASAIGRWKDSLDANDIKTIEKNCSQLMQELNYS